MATYALRLRRYMDDHRSPAEAIGQVAVKARANAVRNARAHQRRAVTLDEIMGLRMVVGPLTLLQCCFTSEGSAAVVLTAAPAACSRAVRIGGAALRTDPHHGPGVSNPDAVTLAGRDACAQAGLGPGEIDLAQVHDASTIGEILRIEALGLVPESDGWVATREGRTALHGALPVNTDGGLLAMGHPFGASGIRMLHETTIPLRGQAGPCQVERARAGLDRCSGAGGVCTVLIASLQARPSAGEQHHPVARSNGAGGTSPAGGIDWSPVSGRAGPTGTTASIATAMIRRGFTRPGGRSTGSAAPEMQVQLRIAPSDQAVVLHCSSTLPAI